MNDDVIVFVAVGFAAFVMSRASSAAIDSLQSGYFTDYVYPPATPTTNSLSPWAEPVIDEYDGYGFDVPNPTSPSDELLALLISPRVEGFSATKYPDPKNQTKTYSIGYGHLILPGEPYANAGYTMSRDEAYALFLSDVAKHTLQINNVNVPLTQYQYDALASFGYNAGANSLQRYGVLEALNNYDFQLAVDLMGRITNNNSLELVNRRKWEAALFLYGIYPTVV